VKRLVVLGIQLLLIVVVLLLNQLVVIKPHLGVTGNGIQYLVQLKIVVNRVVIYSGLMIIILAVLTIITALKLGVLCKPDVRVHIKGRAIVLEYTTVVLLRVIAIQTKQPVKIHVALGINQFILV